MKLRVKQILKQKGLTYADLAQMIGLSTQTIKQTLNKSSWNTTTLETFAAALGVSVLDLIDSESESTPQAILGESRIICPSCGETIALHIDSVTNADTPTQTTQKPPTIA